MGFQSKEQTIPLTRGAKSVPYHPQSQFSKFHQPNGEKNRRNLTLGVNKIGTGAGAGQTVNL